MITQDDINCELDNARLIQRLRHRNIVEILSLAADVSWRDADGRSANFIQMEMCQRDLESYIIGLRRENKTITLREYFLILVDIVTGVAHLHKNHLIHRDIKAANSIVSHYELIANCSNV